MSTPATSALRITVVMTHPIQYFSPWFRWMAQHAPELDLTVLYAAVPGAEQQGKAFGESFEWDVPLLEGYRYEVCQEPEGKDFSDEAFWGIDVPGVGDRIAATAPDVVVVAGWHSAFQVRALLACRQRGIPAVYRGDSTLLTAPKGWRLWLWLARTWLLLRLFRGWLSVGTRAGEYLRRFGLPAARIASSPHCVDHAWFAERAARTRGEGRGLEKRRALAIPADDFVVLFVGRMIARKRPVDAVQAVARLGAPVTLVLAGSGPVQQAALREAARLRVRTVAPGFMNQSELADLYAAADVLVVPSEWETWGLVVNEALASGVPCVVSAGVPAGVDLIEDGANGWVTPVGDVQAMATALSAVHQGLRDGRYGVEECQRRVDRRGFREATEGLVALGRALAATGRGRA